MKTPFHSLAHSLQTPGSNSGNTKTSVVSFLMMFVLCSTMMSGCRKETDEFLRRPFSNGKVFIQIGGRKWMIDDSYPSFFSSDNKGEIDPLGRGYLGFDTVNGKVCRTIGFACISQNEDKQNVSCNISIQYFEGVKGSWTPIRVYGHASTDFNIQDSIFNCKKILSGNISQVHRLNYTWHQGMISFEGKPYNSPNSIPKIITIKFLLKS